MLADIATQVDGRAPSTSRSAIPTSSTARRTRDGSSSRCTARFPASATTSRSRSSTCAATPDLLPVLRDTGCLFVTSAVEAVDDHILERLDKGHTRADFVAVVAADARGRAALAPTFVAFTPWTTLDGYVDLLQTIADLDLVEAVALDPTRDPPAAAGRVAPDGAARDPRARRIARPRRAGTRVAAPGPARRPPAARRAAAGRPQLHAPRAAVFDEVMALGACRRRPTRARYGPPRAARATVPF